MTIRVCHISDTHEMHETIKVPECDVLIHTGDATNRGGWENFHAFFAWMDCQNTKKRIFIPGNHDVVERYDARQRVQELEALERLAAENGVEFYTQKCVIDVFGIQTLVHPVTAFDFWHDWDWSCNRKAGMKHWDEWSRTEYKPEMILTHGPPLGIQDIDRNNKHLGCAGMRGYIEQVGSVRAVLCGHIHEDYGLSISQVPGRPDLRVSNAAIAGRDVEPRVLWI